MLERHGVREVRIKRTARKFTERYSPNKREIYLRKPSSPSLSEIGIAAHEAAHAVQEDIFSQLCRLRTMVYPVLDRVAPISIPLVLAGIIFYWPLILAGIAIYLTVVIFDFLFLPLEIDANRRALSFLGDQSSFSNSELTEIRDFLNTAMWTHFTFASLGSLGFLDLIFKDSG